jgi:hypothetical protein
MTTLEERLRVTYAAVAERTVVGERPIVDLVAEHRRRRNRPALAAVAVAVSLVIVLATALLVGGGRETDDVDVATTPAPTTPQLRLEQRTEEVPVPDELQGSLGVEPMPDVRAGDVRAYSVDGARPFAFGDLARTESIERLDLPGRCVIWKPLSFTDTEQNTASCSGASRYPMSASLSDFPEAGQETIVWADLPTGTAYVTADVGGQTLRLVPVDGLVAFVIPQRPPFRAEVRPSPDRFVRLEAHGPLGKVLRDDIV